MRIKRANFKFNQLINVDNKKSKYNHILMEQEDINVDNNVHVYILRIICANFYIIAKKKAEGFYFFRFLFISFKNVYD